MTKTLAQKKKNEKVVIKDVIGENRLKKRLLELGFVEGTKLFISQIAPLGDPIEVKIRGYLISLRKRDASNILIE